MLLKNGAEPLGPTLQLRLILMLVLSIAFLLFNYAEAAPHKGISVQATLRKPDGSYPNASGLTFKVSILDPVTNCVLREEVHSGVTLTNGYFNLVIGGSTATTPAGNNPSPVLTIAEVMDNSKTRTGLTCLDPNNGVASTGSTYVPADSHIRKLRLTATILGDPIIVDFNMRAIAYAVNAENLSGKTAAEFVQTSGAITQANVQSIFARYGTLDSILNGTYAGNAATATSLATAPGACPAGQYMNAMTASGAITCGTPAGGGSGSVTSVTSANSYLSVATGTSTPVLTLNVGTAANTVAAGNDSRFADSRAPNGTAGGDLSGTYPNPTVAKIAGKSVVLTTPANGEFLKYDGTNFVNSAISTADATKLPLAGGTMTGAIDMGSQNLTNLGFVTMSANKNLHLSNNASDPSGLVAADKGKIWFNSTTGEVKYWNGSAAQSLGVAGSGLANFNTQTGTTQTLAIGTSGTGPAWNSASNTHTLNIPMASTASVTAGLLSKTDYDAFNAKLGTATAFSGDVTGTYGATSVDKIKGKAVAPTTYAAGQTLRYDGTSWINSVLNFADLGSKPTTLAGYGITDAQSSTLADGKIFVGNSSNVATAVTMSGDATLSNAGALTLATVPISKGGTGVTSFTGDRVITTSAAGALQATSCGVGQVISFTAGGAITCATPGTSDSTKLPLAGGTMSGAIDMASQNLTTVGFVTMAANKNFHLSNNSSDPTGLVAADKGKMWFNSTTGEVKYWDGSAAQPLGVAGSGLANFNTQTGTTQTLAIGTSGTAPAWNSASNTHTLNIPMASTASVTAGLLSKTDYDAFNAKLGTATSFSGDVSGAYNATSVDKIKGKAVAPTTYAAGQTLRYDGTNWINSVLNFADLGSKPTTLAGYGITDAQSSTLADGKIFVGNGSNVATAVTMSGDATLSNTGALTLATVPISKGGTGVTSFTGDKIVTTSAAGALQTSSCALGEVISFTAGGAITCAPNADATKLPLAGGTMTGAIDMGSQNLTNVGFVTMAANKNFHLSNNASDPTGLAAADKGKIWFNSTTGEIKYWNGSAAQPLGVAGSGLQTFNTQTGTSQTLAIGTSGTAPAWNSASNTHTLNLPMASTASVTAGLLSKTDYDAFNAKLGTATSFAGDVTGTSSALSVDKIKGKTVSATTYAAGQTLRYDGTNWVNAVLGFADLGSKPTTLAGYGITDAQSSTLADGKILIGNGSNVATAVTMSGDATLSNAGALTLATVPISKGGTGVTSFTGDKVITTSAAGALQATSCALNQVISFTAGGAITCATPNAGTVTSVTSASSYLSVATGTTTPVITANVGTTASTLAAGDDARFTDSRAPSGTAGGDLSGTYPNPTVAKIAGKSVVLTTPANGEVLKYDGTNFVNATISTTDATKLPLAGGTMTGAIAMGGQNITNTGFITMATDKSLHLSNNSADPSGLVAADKGKIWFNSTAGVIKYWDGSAAQSLGAGGSGLSTFNTQTGSTQTLAIGTSGTAPTWNSATNTHTLNIPMASTASVTAGLLSKTDYDAFNAKLGTGTSFSGDVSGAYNATSVDKIKGKTVSATTYAAGQTLRYDGTNWVNSVLAFADLGTKPTTLSGYGITDAQSTTLSSAKILVGNGSNVATAVSVSGDATMSNTGALTLATVPIAKGGTGLTSFASDKLVTTSAGGAIQTSSCGLNQVISFTAGGAITCANVSSLVSDFTNGGNSFAAAATLGTNDAYALNFETNNVTHMTVLSDGKVGVGTATPGEKLEVSGNVKATSGQMYASQNTVTSGATIDFNTGNVQVVTTPGASALTLNNMKDGGSYTVIVTDSTSRTYTFTNCTNPHFVPDNGATIAGSRTIYTILKTTESSATHCYISWITGF